LNPFHPGRHHPIASAHGYTSAHTHHFYSIEKAALGSSSDISLSLVHSQ
jgi:cellobiose-specific phosphotransferase system component IIA